MRKFTPTVVDLILLLFVVSFWCMPEAALAQTSPFLTGATSLQTNILAWATPIAVILVMALGIMAMANRISWGWPVAAIVGIAVVFGAPQMVTWIRGMFGV
jgi:type IV secretion system protein VirB2